MVIVQKLDTDIKTVAKGIIQGNEKRKKRVRARMASPFDIRAVEAVDAALRGSCDNITSQEARKQMQDKIYQSIIYSMPYEYMADVACGRRQFYEYRMGFIERVADELDMIPGRSREGMKDEY